MYETFLGVDLKTIRDRLYLLIVITAIATKSKSFFIIKDFKGYLIKDS